MSTEMSTFTGAYAVNALTGPERAEFEHHLAVCQECSQEVHELTEAAARLGAGAAVEPQPELKARVLREIAQTRQEPPATGPTSIGSRSARWRSRLATRIAVAASVVAIAAAGVLGGVAWQSHRELEQVREQMAQAGARGGEMAEVLQAGDARIVHGASGDASATAVVSEEMGKAMFMGKRMPALPRDKVHQLWAISPGGASSMGVLERGDMPIVHHMPADTRELGVTVEPQGGSPQPTTDPVMLLSVRT
ncbi:hypothetical protein BJF85_25235 [Saccharomonospora sp. CUA-673]|uniref:anti-sigma factor n=1 Tax=Saccharomonospora sp. CUA-673 TaxID=1904969 RepID=UPI00095C9F47|nr:anti-sigma factor [Saccharomonospora sp. CUA-673]OLT40338.1 hypothetical protein BJF85_25235 [Saccharomonospora sp. CUA-673]